jgi:hypothetical protein
MLIGETWKEAEFLINHSKPAIAGKRQLQVLDRHRSSANNRKQDKAAERQEIVTEIVKGSGAAHCALVRKVQNYFEKNYDGLGIKVTDRTIRSDLKKVGKTG